MNTTEAKAPCPLAVMNGAIALLDMHGESDYVELTEARAKVAELVAADREYDEARLAYQRARKGLLPHQGANEKVRFLAADARRAAALAAFSEVRP